MIYLIAAMTKDGIIGHGNNLPWHIPEELQHFKQRTLDQTVIMGRRTFESIGKPLPRRYNIVLSSPDLIIPAERGMVCQTTEAALQAAQQQKKDIFIIGGAYTYAQFLPFVDQLIISYIKENYHGDVYFPCTDWSLWKACQQVDYTDFEVVIYNRN